MKFLILATIFGQIKALTIRNYNLTNMLFEILFFDKSVFWQKIFDKRRFEENYFVFDKKLSDKDGFDVFF